MSLIVGSKESSTSHPGTLGRKDVARGRTRKRFEQVIHLPDPVVPAAYFRRKRALDLVLGSVLLVVSLPLLAAMWLLVWLTSRGPGLFRQERVGQDGRVFVVHKIRTMHRNVEERMGIMKSPPGDPRRTRLGSLLCFFHLDELPQLVNVVRGEMSLVGPRPERPEFARLFSTAIPGYRNRLRIRPGITGLAQLNLPLDSNLCSTCHKLFLDISYVQNGTLWLDIRILLGTFLRLFKLPGAWSLRPLGLQRQVWVQDCVIGLATACGTDSEGNGHNGQDQNGHVLGLDELARHCASAQRLEEAVDAWRIEPEYSMSKPLIDDSRWSEEDGDGKSNGEKSGKPASCAPRITSRWHAPQWHALFENTSTVNAFTVDVEDYYHVSGFEAQVSRDCWDKYESRVVANTQRVLRLLERHGVRATFFVLGWVADRYPDLVRQIDAEGHEIGSHGYWHRLIYRQTVDEFRDDLRRSREVLEAIVGKPIRMYRAPSFSITARSCWALDVLAQEGFEIDSSIFPIYHDLYGMPGADPTVHEITTDHGSLWEFPPTVVPVANWNFPVGGGGYFRIYPLALTLRWLHLVNRQLGRPFLFYVHPWELDPDQPRIAGASRRSRFRHYTNLSRTEQRLDHLLREFRFAPLSHLIPRKAPHSCYLAPECVELPPAADAASPPGLATQPN